MSLRAKIDFAGIHFGIGVLFLAASTTLAQQVVVDATPSHVVNSFSPIRALGAGVDRLRSGEGAPKVAKGAITKQGVEENTDKLLSGPVLKAILGAGWQSVTYRQNTELQIEAWHWNPRGTWSNPKKQEGYFTSSAQPTEMIHHSWSYPLPHRGDTVGDGDGWSRLTDGNLQSYWKSDPYLTSKFTGEDDSKHPQWILIDLGKRWTSTRSESHGRIPTQDSMRSSSGPAIWSRSMKEQPRAHGRRFPRVPLKTATAEPRH